MIQLCAARWQHWRKAKFRKSNKTRDGNVLVVTTERVVTKI